MRAPLKPPVGYFVDTGAMQASRRAQVINESGMAVHPLQKDLKAAARLAVAFEARKGQLPKVLHIVRPPKKVAA